MDVQKGFCCKSIDNIQLVRVEDIAVEVSCCCCNCGTITLYSPDVPNGKILIYDIPDAENVYHKLRNSLQNITGKAYIGIKT